MATIITANIGHKDCKKGNILKTRQAFSRLLQENEPILVCLQESNFKKIKRDSKLWENCIIHEKYKTSSKETKANFLYDGNELELTRVCYPDLYSSRLKIRGEADDHLVKRMPMVFVKPSENSTLKLNEFICVSWHGPFKNTNASEKKIELTCMLEIVTTFSKKQKQPFVIGGDFNLPKSDAEEALGSFDEITIPDYVPSHRRHGRIIDFFILSKALNLTDIMPVLWGSEEENNILDHDPVSSKLRFDSSEDSQHTEEASNLTDVESVLGDSEEENNILDHDPVSSNPRFDSSEDSQHTEEASNLTDVESVLGDSEEENNILDHDPVSSNPRFDSSEDSQHIEESIKDEPNETDYGIADLTENLTVSEKHNIKNEDTENVNEESGKEFMKEIMNEIMEKLKEIIKETFNEKKENYSTKSSKKSKEEIKIEIVEEVKEKFAAL